MLTLREACSSLAGKQQQDYFFLRSYVASECPLVMKALRLVEADRAERKRGKGYNLVKREHQGLGFVYYVRYWHEGKMLPSKWCTHTNEIGAARAFAIKNREGLIGRYVQKKGGGMARFFRTFYDPGSAAYRSDALRSGGLSGERRHRFSSVMANKFLPYLRSRGIETFEQITVPVLDDFQDTLLLAGKKPRTIRDNIAAVDRAFKYLVRKGLVKENPCASLAAIPQRQGDRRTHGCYELTRLRGIFRKRWKDKVSLLLNLLIYSTNMRNGEIRSFCMNDVVMIGGCRFIDLKKSKTGNGVRLVPVHEGVYKKVASYAAGLAGDEPVFACISSYRFTKAYRDLGAMLQVDDAFLRERNITYYSGRHYWKTMMSAGGLGEDAEEVFMGHKVSGDVSKVYNHRDMLGKGAIVKKAREVFKILDAYLFASR